MIFGPANNEFNKFLQYSEECRTFTESLNQHTFFPSELKPSLLLVLSLNLEVCFCELGSLGNKKPSVPCSMYFKTEFEKCNLSRVLTKGNATLGKR